MTFKVCPQDPVTSSHNLLLPSNHHLTVSPTHKSPPALGRCPPRPPAREALPPAGCSPTDSPLARPRLAGASWVRSARSHLLTKPLCGTPLFHSLWRPAQWQSNFSCAVTDSQLSHTDYFHNMGLIPPRYKQRNAWRVPCHSPKQNIKTVLCLRKALDKDEKSEPPGTGRFQKRKSGSGWGGGPQSRSWGCALCTGRRGGGQGGPSFLFSATSVLSPTPYVAWAPDPRLVLCALLSSDSFLIILICKQHLTVRDRYRAKWPHQHFGNYFM